MQATMLAGGFMSLPENCLSRRWRYDKLGQSFFFIYINAILLYVHNQIFTKIFQELVLQVIQNQIFTKIFQELVLQVIKTVAHSPGTQWLPNTYPTSGGQKHGS